MWILSSININKPTPQIDCHCRDIVWEKGVCADTISQTSLCGHRLPLQGCEQQIVYVEFKEILCWGWVLHGGPDEVMRPHLLAVIWGLPLSHGFVCWSLHTDCAISCNWLYAECWQIQNLRLYLYWFASVHLIYPESRFVGRQRPVRSQSFLSLSMLSDIVLMAP